MSNTQKRRTSLHKKCKRNKGKSNLLLPPLSKESQTQQCPVRKCPVQLDQHSFIHFIDSLIKRLLHKELCSKWSLKHISNCRSFFPSLLLSLSEAFIRELCFTCRCVRDHLKPNVSRNVGSWRTVISIISQRRTELNYQHGCVQTRAKLITLGWSPCCLCPRSTRSQLTTWRFIAGTVRLPTIPKLSILHVTIPHLEHTEGSK